MEAAGAGSAGSDAAGTTTEAAFPSTIPAKRALPRRRLRCLVADSPEVRASEASCGGPEAGEGVTLRWPDGVPEEVLTLRALRGELRDLVMRAAERGVEPEDLAGLGERDGRPE